MARKLKPGVHNVRVGGKLRRVRVNAKGQWRFLKGKPRASPRPRKRASAKRGRVKRARRTSPTRRRNPRMARKKSSIVNRLANGMLLLLAFSPAIQIFLSRSGDKPKDLIDLYTAGVSKGRFDQGLALRAYGPVAASFILFEVKKMAMKKFRF